MVAQARKLTLVVTALIVLALLFAVVPLASWQPATASPAAVAINADLYDASDEYSPSPNVVFISDQVGYAFYIDTSGDDPRYKKTTDGGATWSPAAGVDLGTDKNWANIAVWYDQWTPGDTTGTKIHIVASEASTDDTWYRWLDTSDDSLRSDWIAVRTGSSFAPYDGGPSITKSTAGYLFISAFSATAGHRGISKSEDGGDNWTDITPSYLFDDDDDDAQLLPLSGGDVLCIYADETADTVYWFVWDEDTDSWGSQNTLDSWELGTSYYEVAWGASLYKSTGDIYLAGNTRPDGGTSYPLKAYKFTESNRSWSTLSDIAAVAEALQVTMAVDECNGDLYAVYIRGGSAGSSTSVYYKKSTDGGSSWGAESSALNTAEVDDYRYVRTNFMSNERIYTVWYDDDSNDLFGDTVADLIPAVVTVDTTGTQTDSMGIPSTDNYVGGAFTFVRGTGSTTVTQIIITDTGNVSANAHLSNVRIYYETAGTCEYNGATLFGTAASFNASEKATVSGTMSVGTDQVCVYVVLDVVEGASDGQTVEIEISNPSTEVTVSEGTVSPSTAVAISGTTTLHTPPNEPPAAPINIKCENEINPTGVTDQTPDLGAEYDDPDTGDIAAYYQCQVIEDGGSWASPKWDSGKTSCNVTEGSRMEISYGGSALPLDGKKYYQRWKFWDDDGAEGNWSAGTDYWVMAQTPSAPTLYNIDTVTEQQISFNNVKQNTTTPRFRASATHTANFDRFQIELNDQADFGGTSYTQTFSGTYVSGTQYNLLADSLSPSLPTTDGATYYVRTRASADAGANWGSWSTGTWSFTYNAADEDPMWFQTTDEQFATDNLSDTAVDSGNDRVMLAGGGGSGFNFFTNAIDKTPTTTDSWQDIDVSGDGVPAGATGVIIAMLSTSGTSDAGGVKIRHPDSTDNETNYTFYRRATVYGMCGLNASRVFQGYVKGAESKIYLVGYTDSNCGFFTNRIEKTPTAGAWTDVDLSGDIPTGATGAIFEMVNEDTTYRGGTARKNGSTWDIKAESDIGEGRHIYVLTGVDSDRICEVYRETTSVKVYLVGYTKNPVTFITNPEEVGTTTLDTWTDVDITTETSESADGAIFDAYNTGAAVLGDELAVRENGSSDTWGSENGRFWSHNHVNYLCGLDSNQVFEHYRGEDSAHIYLLGYCEPGGFADTGTITSTTINYSWVPGATDWGQLLFTDDEDTNGDIKYDVQYWDGDSWENTPITNKDNSPVDISSLDPETHSLIRIKATLTKGTDTPYLQDWTVTWSVGAPPVVSINVTPTDWDLGQVDEGTTYWSNGGTGPDWGDGLGDAECYFTINNTSNVAINITIHTADWTGGVGWTCSDTATVGVDTFGMYAGASGTATEGDMVIVRKTESYNILKANLAAYTDIKFELKLLTPSSFTDGVEKTGTVTLTATSSE